MSTSTKPEVVVVTGATAGLGRAIVEAFARQGAHIGLLARGEQRLELTKARVEELGGKAIGISTDVADYDQIKQAAERVEQEFGPIDIWINNAMTSVFAPVHEVKPEEFRRVTEVTYLGMVYGTQVALEHMRPRNEGSIVLVGSALAKRGIPLQAAYCASKHAVQGFFESLRTELLHENSNIRLSIAHMPAMNTPQFDWVKSRLPHKAQPVPPIYEPEVCADAVVYAAHNKRREIYVGASTVKTVFGNRIAPWFADWYLARTGYQSQQTDELENPDRPDNLWEPVGGDPGAHGRFEGDKSLRHSSLQLWATKHRAGLGVAAVGLGLAVGLTAGLRS